MENINKFKLKGFDEFVLQYGRDNELDIDRSTIIGGSDVPIIMGVSPFISAEELYCQKLGLVESNFSKEAKLRMSIGKMMEDFITCLFLDYSGINTEVIRDKRFTTNFGKFKNNFTAQCDLIIENKIYEIKNISFFSKHWKNEYKELIVPIYYQYQIYWQMMISGIKNANLLVYNNVEQQLYILPVEYPPIDLEKKIFKSCEHFLERLINKNEKITELDFDSLK